LSSRLRSTACPARAQLAERGYSLLAGALPPARVAALVASAERAGLTGNERQIARRLPAAADLAQSPELGQLAEQLLGAPARLVRLLWFDKTPTRNWPVLWHQDRTIALAERVELEGYGPWSEKAGVVHVEPPLEILARMVTLRLHLDPCGPEAGALRVVPGSQQRKLDRAELDAVVAAGPCEEVQAEAGDVLAMRPLLVHSSGRAARASHRRVLHMEFASGELPRPLRWAGL